VKPFVENLNLYAVMDEQVMFPTAVLVGEYLRLKSEIGNGSKNKRMETNETLATIYTRRAVRKYQEKQVDKELIEQIIDAGRMAPSAMNRQLWKFYVLTDRKLINSLSPFIVKVANKVLNWAHGVDPSKTADIIFHNAPAVIFITAPKKNQWVALDVGMCCQNMMLAAKSLGLDTCPIGLAKFLEETEKISILGMSHSEQIQLALIVGYGDERPAVHERKRDNVKFVTASEELV
jgi:nitroreductase